MYYASNGNFAAVCNCGHTRLCAITRKAKRARLTICDPRDRRPLGWFVAWLAVGHLETSRDGHGCRSHFTVSDYADGRRALGHAPGGQDLLKMEEDLLVAGVPEVSTPKKKGRVVPGPACLLVVTFCTVSF